jgi:hypothetical protein
MKKAKSIRCYLNHCLWGAVVAIFPAISQAQDGGSVAEGLQKSLAKQGWQAYQAEDGSLIYRQPVAAANAGLQQNDTQEADWARFNEALESRGWRAEWGSKGVLTLKPVVDQDSEAPASASVQVQAQSEIIPELPGFEYWRIVKSQDGSTLFYPLTTTHADVSPAVDLPGSRCCESGRAVSQRVSLPVDEWAEAKEQAENWLISSGLQGMQVGRIRKVLRVYLVSLVSESPPHVLTHQLAIRASDGCVFVVD